MLRGTGPEGVFHQRSYGHRTNASGYRRNVAAFRRNFSIVDISAEGKSTFLRGVFYSRYSHVYNHRPFFYHVRFQESGSSQCRYDQIGTLQISLIFFVCEWQTVTVQFPGLVLLLNNMLMGLPTILLLPMTTAFIPFVSIL